MTLALFDFDGTLTTKDSLGEFIKFVVGKKKYFFTLIKFAPIFVLWQLKIIRNYKAKEMLFKMFFKDFDEKRFRELGKKFSLEELDGMLRKNTYAKFREHIKNGDRVIIVSASMKCWLKEWSDKEGVELLSTELLFENGKYSGKFLTKNCHGIEKQSRIKEHLSLDDYNTIYAYGDSSGDTEMLSIAHHKYLIKSGYIIDV